MAERVLIGVLFAMLSIVPAASVEEAPSEIYVPTDLEDCFSALDSLLKTEDIEKMRKGTEEDMIQYHFGLGMWMRNNWGLWGGSHLAEWFNEIGVHHPDDMSGIILNSYWRYLNSRPIKLDEQVEYYQRFWEENSEEEDADA